MAGVKKSTAKVSTVKEEVKLEEKAAKEAPAKKTAAKKTTTTVRKTPVRKTAAKKEEAVKDEAVAAAVKETVNFQFSGKSYTPEDLLKSCKDVWKYDLGGKEEDIKSIELYVKPEENSTYYVINGDVTGSFFI
ncbi:MAG: hypothetical protein HFI43_08485 [Lachnospiraceae bacterium]|jgi:hypothetical protein|nr:hypothetical protein [Lachnospiraceae bacterium]GFI15047.1 hypothetical protein IMSAGC009_00202 [Lachnospiraceae bacterium]